MFTIDGPDKNNYTARLKYARMKFQSSASLLSRLKSAKGSGIPRYASPPTEIIEMNTAQRVSKECHKNWFGRKRRSEAINSGYQEKVWWVCSRTISRYAPKKSRNPTIDISINIIVIDVLDKPKDAQKDTGVVPGFEPGASRNFDTCASKALERC